jgi:hypothetical protein
MSENTEAVAILDVRGVDWQSVTDVSGRVLSMFKDQAVHIKNNSSWSSWLLKIRPMFLPETSVTIYQPMPRNIREERRHQVHRSASFEILPENFSTV